MSCDQSSHALIAERVGRINTDVLLGWEAGLLGKERVGRKLFDRQPPPHLTGQRYLDWLAGHDGARQYKESMGRRTYFTGTGPNGTIEVVRAGWVARGKVISQMERAGATGDVYVRYLENGQVKRTVTCGI